MFSYRPLTTRIPTVRPLRPPSLLPTRVPKPRLFTQNSQLLLLAQQRSAPRPQLPYLSPPIQTQQHLHPLNQHVIRLFSTETKRYVKEQVWLATKWTAILWTFIFFGSVLWYGISIELEEHDNPTPTEWKFFTRRALRAARALSSRETAEQVGFINWPAVHAHYRELLTRLENPHGEGKGLVEGAGEGEEIMIEGVGRAGFDISAKSWPWRAGYFEAIMGCATAAEHLDSMVLDNSRGIVFPRAVMIGPSNPDPRPTPPYMKTAPREEDCTRPCDPPETYYMRILTGRGFTTKQKMKAASAYANWLEFKGLRESAEEMYKWAVDIAKDALEVDPEQVLDTKSGVLKQADGTASHITPNLLRATTDLATFKARSGDVAAALPILLSVLRARRTAPVSLFPPPSQVASDDSGSGVSKTIWKIFSTARFPDPPPSGDNSLIRSTEKPSCEESELMLYIGEILFATSPKSDEGLGWTRQAANIADISLGNRATPSSDLGSAEETKKCKECLLTGVSNWEAMLNRLASQEQTSPKKGWFNWGSTSSTSDRLVELADDQRRVTVLKERIAREGILAEVKGHSNPSGIWIG
ncbi:hypothetical protein DOTSEDRAFT_96319 [Lecanosticta acicola]|uniref:MFS maltose permease n=1 Tax=Lecanosticta acicola TaxID=111012 RepID=A0AAI8Z9G7_9PEZI|nr:hypothetical protein DOTSEDRAFT_96319 [Lecanosticta acicola]